MRVGRNEPCPCGSGNKFKNCCEEKTARKSSTGMILLGLALAGIAVMAMMPLLEGDDDRRAIAAPAATPAAPGSPAAPAATPVANTPKPQPPGPAPAGKVWSPEHGHWHDAPGTGSSPIRIESSTPGLVATAAPAGQSSPPPGEKPQPGKVWSAEHGHWHDIDDTTKPTSLGIVNPPGEPVTTPPPGPAPAGKVWSAEHGHWHDAPKKP